MKFTDLTKLKKFTVTATCLKCGSTEVKIENTLDYDAKDGGWGHVALYCTKCNMEEELASN